MVAKKKQAITKPIAKKKATSVAEQNKAKDKPKKEKPEKKLINLEHDFSFNLLTESWIPVIPINGKKKFLSLSEFLEQAHELERFDFPLPGLETAMIRFLVAIVYIVGAPKDQADWEKCYSRGKFIAEFIQELQQYKDKLDLFSKTEPFLQEVEIFDNTVKPISKLIDMFPSGNNSSHFGTLDLKKDISEQYIHSSIALPFLLYCYMGVLAGTDGDGGLNGGATPYYVSLHTDNLFKTILLNTLDQARIKTELSSKQKCKEPESGWLESFDSDINLNGLSIQSAILWKPRRIRLIPTKANNVVCAVSGLPINDLGIKEISYTKQKVSIAKTDFWEDTFNAIVEEPKGKKIEIKKSKPFGDLPSWKDFPNLVLLEKKQEGLKFVNPPLIVRRLLDISAKIEKNISISVLGVITNKAKILRISESKFPFKPSFIEDEQIVSNLKLIVQKTKSFEGKILFSLVLAYKLEKKIQTKQGKKIRESLFAMFQSAYWHELGSKFEDSLARLVESDKYADEVYDEWRKMLASHVRKTFERHTEKLIHNPKNLKSCESGRTYLKNQIKGILK